MAKPASSSDLVNVMYEQVDALRRKIGVAPIRLARDPEQPRLLVSVMPGMRNKVPATLTMRVRGEEVDISLLAVENYAE